jgi:YVTN family beta-propeller protein
MKFTARIVATISSLAMAAAVFAASGYQKTKTVGLAGPTGWDYVTVDSAAQKVYIANSTQVQVLDSDTLAVAGVVPGIAGAHGVAIATGLNKGFATEGKADEVTVFDTATLKVTAKVKVGKKPDAIVYDPASKRIFAMNGDGESTTAINAADNSIAGTVAIGGGPEFTVVDGKGNLWVNLEDQSELVQIDTNELKVLHHWPVAPCSAPSSLAFDAKNRVLFLGCRSKVLAVVNADSGVVLKTYPIGDHVDATQFDPETGLVFSSTGDGHVYIFHQDAADQYSLVDTLTTLAGSKTMGLDPKSHRIYVPANDQGKFTVMAFDKK